MTDNKFEDLFRKRLLKYASPVPENMWERIKQKKKRDRPFLFIVWLFTICILLLAGSYFIFYLNKKAIQNKTTVENNKRSSSQNSTNQILKASAENKDVINKASAIVSKKIKPDNQNKNKNFTHSSRSSYYKNNLPSKRAHNIQQTNIDSSIKKDSSGLNSAVQTIYTSQNKSKSNISKDPSAKNILKPPLIKEKKENKVLLDKEKNWFVKLNVSPDIPYFERTNDNSNIFTRGERTPFSFTIGISIGKYLSERFSAKTGLQYSQISEKFRDSIIIIDRYRSIDIPFLIGYNFKSSQLKTTINAGFIYNVYTWYQGKTIVDYRGLIDLNTADIYKHNTGMSFYLGTNFSKQINNKFDIIVEPYFRYRLSYMTKTTAPFNQKINVAGINLGLRYNFKKSKKNR